MKKISEKTKYYLELVASNTSIQKQVLSSMFDGCEVGTDIWEYIEYNNLPDDIDFAIHGLSKSQRELLDSDEEMTDAIENIRDYDALYYNPDLAKMLINRVRSKILEKI